MEKPKNIYSTRYFLICLYPGFTQRKFWYNVPTVWHNFHSDNPDIDDKYVNEVVKELWVEWVDQTGYKWRNTVHLYVFEFDDEDKFSRAERAIETLNEDRGTIDIHQYNYLLDVLQ